MWVFFCGGQGAHETTVYLVFEILCTHCEHMGSVLVVYVCVKAPILHVYIVVGVIYEYLR